MAYFNELITEVKIGDDKKIDSILNIALKQIFKKEYLDKIESTIKSKIKVKEKIHNDNFVAAWTEGTIIYLNTPKFFSLDLKKRIDILLHEFMHVLNNSKSFFILNKFNEVKKISKELWEIVTTHSKDPGMLLLGKKIQKKWLNNQEPLSYLMNGRYNWNWITPEGKKLFIEALKKYGVFDIENEFWKKRL